jgi:hypothetical protein
MGGGHFVLGRLVVGSWLVVALLKEVFSAAFVSSWCYWLCMD